MKNEITAKRLSLALSNANLRPQELADKSGVSKSSISQYVNGLHAPSDVSSDKMAMVLDVNPLWLMGFDVEMKKTYTNPMEYINDRYPSVKHPDFKTLKKVEEGKEKQSVLFDLYVDVNENKVYLPNHLFYIHVYLDEYLKSDEEKDKLLDFINSYSMLNDDGKDKLLEHINLLLKASAYSNDEIKGVIEKIRDSM